MPGVPAGWGWSTGSTPAYSAACSARTWAKAAVAAVADEDLDGHRAGDAVQMEDVGPGEVAAGAVGRGPDDGIAGGIGVVLWPGRLPSTIAGRPVAKGPGQLPAPRRAVHGVDGPHGVGGPDGT